MNLKAGTQSPRITEIKLNVKPNEKNPQYLAQR